MMHKELLEKLDHNKQDYMEVLERIEAQTTKTNGRVSRLENWKSYINGSTAIVASLGVPILGWSVYQIIGLISK